MAVEGCPALLSEAAALFEDGQTVRDVAAVLRISKSEAGRLRKRAVEEGLLRRDGAREASIVRLVPASPSLGGRGWDCDRGLSIM